jgi:vesicle coat complex subunit
MASTMERSCTMLVSADRLGPATTAAEVKAALETGDAPAKAYALQRAIGMLLAGEPISGLFISIVRFVLPSEDHAVQKLLLLYLVRGVAISRCPASPPAPAGLAETKKKTTPTST